MHALLKWFNFVVDFLGIANNWSWIQAWEIGVINSKTNDSLII